MFFTLPKVKFYLLAGLIISQITTTTAFSAEKWSTVTVLGSRDIETSLPGSSALITTEDIRQYTYDDINRILRQVPGVYVRPEDGYGLFPNISLRGADPARSGKVTLMEDGITAAPAPYSAPSAYYSPTAGRMSEIEVLKGSSQVKYGPHTTGGVVNYLSTPIPNERQFYLKGTFGTDQDERVHFHYGDVRDTDVGRFGVLVEEYYRQTNGFKEIDETPDFDGGNRTGFTKSEPMFKVMWESPEDSTYQRVEAKLGYSDIEAQETYLGLSETDFDADPYRRYAATRFDEIQTWNLRKSLSYSRSLTDNIMWNLTGYFNEFHRDWFKLNKAGGVDLSLALAGNDGGTALNILKGQSAGTFNVRHNKRHYAQYGAQNELNFIFDTGDIGHDLDIGFKFHQDYIRRKQNSIDYTQNASGVITGSTINGPGSAGNRRQESHVFSTYIKNDISLGDLVVTPGFRYEKIDYKYIDYGTSGSNSNTITAEDASDLDALAGGLGMQYKLTDTVSLFGGVHQGFSVPGPRDNARSNIKEETSLTTEAGVRYKPTNASQVELVYFHTNFDDLIVTDNIGGSGSGNTENVGDIISQGIELKASYDYGIAANKDFKNPYYVSFTYTNAELDGDSNSTDPESIFAGGVDGAKVPYIPELQFTVGTGLEFDKWSFDITGTYVAETFTTANNSELQRRPDGTLDARFGKTDSYFVVDLGSTYKINENTKLFANIHNVADLEYIVSRHPHGPRPGKPFTALAGIEMLF